MGVSIPRCETFFYYKLVCESVHLRRPQLHVSRRRETILPSLSRETVSVSPVMIYNDVCQTTWDNSTDRIESCRFVFSSDCDVYQTTHGMSKGRLVSMSGSFY